MVMDLVDENTHHVREVGRQAGIRNCIVAHVLPRIKSAGSDISLGSASCLFRCHKTKCFITRSASRITICTKSHREKDTIPQKPYLSDSFIKNGRARRSI